MTTQEIATKRGRGRPSRNIEVHAFNFRLEADLYDAINARKGNLSLTQYLNDLIRKAL